MLCGGALVYEFARSPFDWRLDGGAWSRIRPDDVATDLTELSFFTEVAWRKFGKKELAAGDHVLDIRIDAHKNEKGQTQRVLFGLDALCLTTAEFLPNGKFKPGEDGRTPRDVEAGKTVFEVPERQGPRPRVNVPLAVCGKSAATTRNCRAQSPSRSRNFRTIPSGAPLKFPAIRIHSVTTWFSPIGSGIARVSTFRNPRGPLVPPRLPAEQPEYLRLCQRRALRFPETSIRPFFDRRHQGDQARRQ